MGSSTLRYLYSNCFLKVWLCCILQRQNIYPQDTKAGTLEIVDSIIKGLISAFVDFENHEKNGNANSLPMMLTKFPCDNVLELTEKLTDLMFHYVLTKQSWESVWKNQSQWKWSDPKPDSGIGINIWEIHVSACPLELVPQ